jgi:RNA polymerase sigma-70 factor (ECF subfamily)
MARSQLGDRFAYARLLHEVVPFIRAIAGRQHRTADRVEEVVQDVLLSIHQVRHTYEPARPFHRWLGAIARRRSIDALRRRYRRANLEVEADAVSAAYESYPDPANDRMAEAHACADHLHRAIIRLPALQREAIELLKLRELSLIDASRLTGRSVAALKVNVHRALKALRAQLQAEGPFAAVRARRG